jgi:broad specificity phosphatase PhoE
MNCQASLPEDGATHQDATFMARHGETHSNRVGRYAGRSSESLSDAGRRQMADLASRLAAYGVGEVWTSEIARAQQSAEIVAHALGLPIRVDDRLNEIVMGPWEGLTEAQIATRFPDAYALWQTRPDSVRLDGRETLEHVASRVLAVLRETVPRPRPVLLITHVAPLRTAVLEVLGVSLRYYKRVGVSNAECIIVDYNARDVRRLGASRPLRDELGIVD